MSRRVPPDHCPTRTARTRSTWGRLVLPTTLAMAATSAVISSGPVSASPGSFRQPTVASTLVRAVPLVRLGDRGNSVTLVQQALMSQGIALRGGADGYFGPVTQAAVKTFQGQKGLNPTGEVNETTAHLLGLGPTPALPERGQRSDLVRALQQALLDSAIAVRGGADGYFGPATAAAVQAFQSSRGLAATGAVDLSTGIALGIVAGSQAAATPSAPAAESGQASSISFAANAYLTPGQTGDAVKAMQSALIAAGIAVKGGADGKYGPATSQAVSTYQSAMRLAATGTVDTVTAQLLGLVAGPALPKLGDRGANVASLQQLLINLGIPVRGGADGVFGPVTQAAVTAFQNSQGLPANGAVDMRTALFLGLIPGATPPAKIDPAAPAPTPPTTGAPASNPLQVFPVLGPCYFTDTWGAPRSGGRRHEGVDIIAATGTPVYAVTAGTITRQFFDQEGSLGGNALRLTAPDGTYFHYAHFSTFAEGIKVGSVVRAGEVIGYVGATGNTSTPHLHFEYHPGGGAAVNPYPVTKAIDRCKVTTPPEIIG